MSVWAWVWAWVWALTPKEWVRNSLAFFHVEPYGAWGVNDLAELQNAMEKLLAMEPREMRECRKH